MHIIELKSDNPIGMNQSAEMLVEAFKMHWPNAWPDMQSAMKEVEEALQPGKIARAAVDDDGSILGWVGGSAEYDGHAWELNSLVVHPDSQGKGIGTTLIADFECEVKSRGGITIYLGSDDEDGMTTLANKNLYDDVPAHLANIHNLKHHPYEFYQKQGYSIVGVIPDANGPGKPDIILAKRIM